MKYAIIVTLVVSTWVATSLFVQAEGGPPCGLPPRTSFNPFTHLLAAVFGGAVYALFGHLTNSE